MNIVGRMLVRMQRKIIVRNLFDRGEIAGRDEAFLRASPRVLVYYIRICGNSYTVANQSIRNNCHALATQKMHYNALRNVRAISMDEREFMAHRDRILGRSLGLIFARTTESNLRNG